MSAGPNSPPSPHDQEGSGLVEIVALSDGQYVERALYDKQKAMFQALGVRLLSPSDALRQALADGAADRARLDWLEMKCVEVRDPLPYGSRHIFRTTTDDSFEGEEHPSDLRARIDAALRAEAASPEGLGVSQDAINPLVPVPWRGDRESALRELLLACESDCGVPDENDGDDEPVGRGPDGPMALTFGMLRRAREALAKADAILGLPPPLSAKDSGEGLGSARAQPSPTPKSADTEAAPSAQGEG